MIVLIAEDDAYTRNGLAEVLEGEGYRVMTASDGEEALAVFQRERPDFVCLDIMMPGRSGYDVCRAIRVLDRQVPIMFISAKSEEIDRVLGLELGADDYLMKPFGVREVIARVRAITRRTLAARQDPGHARFSLGAVEVDPAALRAYRGGAAIDLSLREVKLLRCLHDHRGQVVDRDTLLNECWGREYFPNSRTLDQHISQLRKRIERDPKAPEIIQTVHGVGYRYE
jgi:DNA-binding response OmpR family regulator